MGERVSELADMGMTAGLVSVVETVVSHRLTLYLAGRVYANTGY